MIVLGIETSSNCGSVAIAEDKKILGEIFFNTGRKHSTKIVTCINNLLNTVDLDKTELDNKSTKLMTNTFI